MARWLLSTDVVVEFLGRGNDLLESVPLNEVAVSALSFAYILAEIEIDKDLQPIERSRLRANVTRFRDLLRTSGGDIPIIGPEAIDAWGRVHLLELFHANAETGEKEEMATEDRLVVGIALALGYVYVAFERDWNAVLERELQLPIKIV